MPDYITARAWLVENHQTIDAVILDIDGVLLTGATPIEGGHEFIERLRGYQIPFRFLTNDACNPLRNKVDALSKTGITISENDITSAGHGIIDVVQESGMTGQMFFIVGLLGDPQYGTLAGLETTRNLDELKKCRGVIIGEGHYHWEETLNAVINYFIQNPSAPLIVPNPDWYYSIGGGSVRLASGPVAAIVERTLALHGEIVKPVFTGKPYEPIFAHNHHILEQQHGYIEKRRVLMIGDSLTSDIAGAGHFGYITGLTLTGISKESMIDSAAETPDIVFRCV